MFLFPGYHQECHHPAIPAEALEFDAPWMCVYCSIGAFCPYLENPFESKPTRKGVRKTKIHTVKPTYLFTLIYVT